MVKRRSLQAVLAFFLMALFVALAPTSASAASLGPYIIQQIGNLKCVEVPSAGAAGVNATLQTQNCFGNRQQWQQWYFVETGNSNYYRLKNVRSGLCASLYSSQVTPIDVVQKSCTTLTQATLDQWRPINKITSGGLDWYRLQNPNGRCLGTLVPAGTGTPVYQVGSCTGDNTYWTWRF